MPVFNLHSIFVFNANILLTVTKKEAALNKIKNTIPIVNLCSGNFIFSVKIWQ